MTEQYLLLIIHVQTFPTKTNKLTIRQITGQRNCHRNCVSSAKVSESWRCDFTKRGSGLYNGCISHIFADDLGRFKGWVMKGHVWESKPSGRSSEESQVQCLVWHWASSSSRTDSDSHQHKVLPDKLPHIYRPEPDCIPIGKDYFSFLFFLYICFLPDMTIKLQHYVLSCPLLVSAFFAVFPLVPCSSPPRKHPPGKRIIEWQRLTCTLPKTLWFWFGEILYRKENLQSGPVGKINSPKFFHNYTVAQRQGEKSATRRALSVKHAFCSLALTPHRCNNTHWS